MDREQIIEQQLNALLAIRQTLEQQVQAIVQIEREQIIEQQLNALLAIRQALEQQIQAINGQIVQARLECLKDLLDRQQKELADWLEEIDQSLIDCCAYIQEYQRLHTGKCAASAKRFRG